MGERNVLLDTGPLVAVLDRSDQWHSDCVDRVQAAFDRCVTTEAVATEASHLVGRGHASPALPLEFLLAARIPILSLSADMHAGAVSLIRRYSDLPMDYADATLVVLAGALGTGSVLTTDRKGFRAYRWGRDRVFELI